jgi:hypothetical protein
LRDIGKKASVIAMSEALGTFAIEMPHSNMQLMQLPLLMTYRRSRLQSH